MKLQGLPNVEQCLDMTEEGDATDFGGVQIEGPKKRNLGLTRLLVGQRSLFGLRSSSLSLRIIIKHHQNAHLLYLEVESGLLHLQTVAIVESGCCDHSRRRGTRSQATIPTTMENTSLTADQPPYSLSPCLQSWEQDLISWRVEKSAAV